MPLERLARKRGRALSEDAALARGIENVPGVKQAGIRVGNWLVREQASELLNAPDPKTRGGLRDRAILALLIGCGLGRAEILSLEINLDTATRRTLGDTEPGWKEKTAPHRSDAFLG